MHIGTSESVLHTIFALVCTSHVCQNGSVYGACTAGVHIGTSESVLHTIFALVCTSHVCQNGSVYGACTAGVHIGTSEFVLLRTSHVCLYRVGIEGKVTHSHNCIAHLYSALRSPMTHI